MKYIYCLIFSVGVLGFCKNSEPIKNNGSPWILIGKYGKGILKPIIQKKIFRGKYFYSENLKDTLLHFEYGKGDNRDLLIVDSVYFLYADEKLFKCLVKAESSHPNFYLEIDSSGNSKFNEWLGDSILDVKLNKYENYTELRIETFSYNKFGLGENLSICTIKSSNRDTSFTTECIEK